MPSGVSECPGLSITGKLLHGSERLKRLDAGVWCLEVLSFQMKHLPTGESTLQFVAREQAADIGVEHVEDAVPW